MKCSIKSLNFDGSKFSKKKDVIFDKKSEIFRITLIKTQFSYISINFQKFSLVEKI